METYVSSKDEGQQLGLKLKLRCTCIRVALAVKGQQRSPQHASRGQSPQNRSRSLEFLQPFPNTVFQGAKKKKKNPPKNLDAIQNVLLTLKQCCVIIQLCHQVEDATSPKQEIPPGPMSNQDCWKSGKLSLLLPWPVFQCTHFKAKPRIKCTTVNLSLHLAVVLTLGTRCLKSDYLQYQTGLANRKSSAETKRKIH